MRVFIVCGGRNYRDYEALTAALDKAKPDVIIQGECPVLCSKHTYAKRGVATGAGSLKRGGLK